MADYILAHNFSSNHRELLEQDNICGCFYCLKIFNPLEIVEWVYDSKSTAICPFCGVDSIIGEHSGYNITIDFLREMQNYWL